MAQCLGALVENVSTSSKFRTSVRWRRKAAFLPTDSTSVTLRPGHRIFRTSPGKPRSTAHVHQRAPGRNIPGDGLGHRQRVQKVLRLDLGVVGYGREIDACIPLHQLTEVSLKLNRLALLKTETQALGPIEEAPPPA